MNVACVLASWRPDEPAGMERSVAGLLAGLRALGHRGLVITAAPQPHLPDVIRLASLPLRFPSDDATLRAAITQAGPRIDTELADILHDHDVQVVYYVDALWGLGRAAVRDHPARRVLGMHVLGHPVDLGAAFDRGPDTVIAPSARVVQDAATAGYDTAAWRVVSNSLLVADPPAPNREERRALRRCGPVRALARLGAEKGIDHLLHAAVDLDRPVDVAVAGAAFEPEVGVQTRLLGEFHTIAAERANVRLRHALSWRDVPGWLADAAVIVVPSTRETFGLVALEALSVGTPVVAYAVGNLPDLIGDAGILVPAESGPAGLCAATRALLADPVRYEQASAAAWQRARDFRPEIIAHQWLEAALT